MRKLSRCSSPYVYYDREWLGHMNITKEFVRYSGTALEQSAKWNLSNLIQTVLSLVISGTIEQIL